MEYLRIDPRFDEHPDVERAGWWGGQLFHFLLRLSARLDLHGRLDASRQDPAWLVRRWGLTPLDVPTHRSPADVVRVALEHCVEAGLLVREPDGTLRIHGWEKFYTRPLTPTERSRKHRGQDPFTGEPLPAPPHATQTVAPVAPVACNDTPHHTTPLHEGQKQSAGAGRYEDLVPPPRMPQLQADAEESPGPRPWAAEVAGMEREAVRGRKRNGKAQAQLAGVPAKELKRSLQEQIAIGCGEQRAAKLGPGAVPDLHWGRARVNAALKPVADALGVVGALAAHRAFLAAARPAKLTPPFPLWAFAQDWPTYTNGSGGTSAPSATTAPTALNPDEDPYA